MTGTKRLSLHGRLRMAAACPDPNAALLAEAADAIEQHEAFRQEVSDAVTDAVAVINNSEALVACEILERFIIWKPDPLEEALREVVNDAWSNTISRLASGEFKVSEAIGTMIVGVNFDAMRDALTAELRARGVTAPAPAQGE